MRERPRLHVTVWLYGYIVGPSPVPPIYLTGSFGPVPPAWINLSSDSMMLVCMLRIC